MESTNHERELLKDIYKNSIPNYDLKLMNETKKRSFSCSYMTSFLDMQTPGQTRMRDAES